MDSKSKVRAALFGFGYLGKWHAQKLAQQESINFTVIVEPNTKVHEEIKQAYPQVTIHQSMNSALKDFDAAILVTPSSLHQEHVTELIKNNKHVFCEKPLAHSFEGAQALYDLAQKFPHLVLQVGHSERCHEIFENFDTIAKSYQTGQVIFERYGAFKGRALDVSCVEDIMVHDLDLMLFLFKPQLLSCKATGIKSKSKNWDTVRAQFLTKNQIFEFIVSRDAVEERRRLDCYSDFGTSSVDFMHNTLTTTNNELKKITYNKRDHLSFEQNKFFKSIVNKEKVFVNFKDGLRACYLVDLVLKSLELDQELKVNLPC